MKKTLIKTLLVFVAVILLPFLLTMLFTKNSHHRYSVGDLNFEIYYENNGAQNPLEFNQYLQGVVAANMPAGYDIEALKAQAVIARTYALYNISLLKEEEPHKQRFSTSELGLSYINLNDMEQFWGREDYVSYFSKIENSVHGTQDEILIYNDSLILPVFFATGSGFTRNASEAWGVQIPYLVSVQSKQDVTSTNYLKITEYSIQDLITTLEKTYPEIDLTEEYFFKDIEVIERDSTNYVLKIDLAGKIITGEEFAKVTGLNSNHFYLEDYEGKVRIICTGVGHGIGLSQYGAHAMANEGNKYEDILTYYYTGSQLTKIQDLN